MSMTTETTTQEIEHLAKLICGIRIAIMTTVCKDGTLRSRPMATQDSAFDGGLWFFTKADSAKVGEVEEEGQVNVSYENPQESVYVSLSGRATLVQDRQQIERLWNDDLRIWFPEGLNDPQLALLRVDVDKWTCWDARHDNIAEYRGCLKDEPAKVIQDLGDHRRVDISGIWISQDVGTTKTRNEQSMNGLDDAPATEL